MKHKWKAWMIILAALVAGISIATIQNKVVPCIEMLQADLEITKSIAGWLSSVFCVVGIMIALPSAVIVERIGAKKTCIAAIASVIAGSVIGLLTDSIAILVFSRVIEGIGAGLISIAVPVLITMWFPADKRGLPTGIWSSWQFLGQTVSFLIGTAVLGQHGWRGIWWAGLALAFISLGLCIVFVKEPGVKVSDDKSGKDMIFSGKILRSKDLWRVSIAMFSFCFACFGFVTWITSYWNEVLKLEIEAANKMVSLFGIISLPAVIIAGKILDSVDRRKFAIMAAAAYTAIATIGFSMCSVKMLPIFVIVYPLFDGAISTSLMTLVPQCIDDPEQIPAAVGLFTTLSNVGMLIGPPVIGLIADNYGWKWCMTALLMAGIIIVMQMVGIHPASLRIGEE